MASIMTFPLTLLDLAGAIALLLWGSHMVQTGVQRAFGPQLKSILGGALRNRLLALFAGMGVTALLQSSTATGLMTAGFAASGMVDLVPALAVMLGANIGTTLIVQLMSFNVASLAPCLILVGVIMFRRDSSSRTRDLGRALIGLGLMFLALRQLLDLMTVYEDTPSLRMLLGAVSTEPLIDVILAAGLTWAAHSSVAVVLFIMSLAARGAVPPDAAYALVLGANLGAAINPVIEGPMADDPAAQRLPIGNLLTRVIGGAGALAFLYPIGRFMVTIEPDNARSVADFHMLFNLVVAAAFFPLLTPYAWFLRRLFPPRVDENDPSRPVYLDPAAKEIPIVALGAAAREALRLADLLQDMLAGASEALKKGDRRLITQIRRRNGPIDRLEDAIEAYLTALDADELGSDDHRRLKEILTFSSNIAQAADVLSRTFLPLAAKRLKQNGALPEPGQAELFAMMDRLARNLKTAGSLFMTADARAAHLLTDEKIAFREALFKASSEHFDSLRAMRFDEAQASSIYLDLLRELKTANGLIVASAAYPVLERTGELLPSRRAANTP
jgi:phosphate:Na+ symporter